MSNIEKPKGGGALLNCKVPALFVSRSMDTYNLLDNLDVLRSINSNTIQLIATDPPFNKGKDFHHKIEGLAVSTTPDMLNQSKGGRFTDRWRWDKDVHPSWIVKLRADWPRLATMLDTSREIHSESMAAYLCYMSVRLVEMHRVLKNTGNIFLHCDHTASHYLKLLLDVIFGQENFMNEIIWHYGGPGITTNFFPRKHDSILFYAKDSSINVFNKLTKKLPDYLLKRARTDSDGRQWVDQRLGELKPETIEKMKSENRIFETRTGKLRRKQYLDEMDGGQVDNVWDISIINSQANERQGFNTQKPRRLYENIVAAASNENDVVLDPFCGCATTLLAAHDKNRKWIGIDYWDQANNIILKRFHQEFGLLHEPGRDYHVFNEPLIRTDNRELAIDEPQAIPNVDIPIKTAQSKRRLFSMNNKERAMRLSKLLSVQRQDPRLTGNECYCECCRMIMPHERNLEIDHKFSRKQMHEMDITDKEWVNDINNLTLLCGPCNVLKGGGYHTIETLRELLVQRKEFPPRKYIIDDRM